MKKIILSCLFSVLLLLNANQAFALDLFYEPESDAAVSYTVYDIAYRDWETSFINYAKADGSSEYWIRLGLRKPKSKILHYITLSIDDVKYRVISAPVDEKHIMAGLRATNESVSGTESPIVTTKYRYFDLTPDLVTKLLNAKKVIVFANRVKHLNTKLVVNEKMQNEIRKHFALTYNDFSKYWHPTDD